MSARSPLAERNGGVAGLLAWRDAQRARSRLRCERMPLHASCSWTFRDGALRHASGGFFGVVGVAATSNVPSLDGLHQPLVDQPEIGILGLLLRDARGGPELLVQAKTEPGAVGDVQFGPTVQATRSNYRRVHGGAGTPYLDRFIAAGPDGRVADGPQSEQGTRFLAKYNRNVTVLADGEGPAPAGPAWRWCRVSDVRALLTRDYCVNTDARSALVCSDWRLLAGNEPFARWRDPESFGARLRHSYALAECSAPPRIALDQLRARVSLDVRHVPLEHLDGWIVDEKRIADLQGRAFEIGMYRVHAADREVTDWEQPLVANALPGTAVLACQRRDGALRFLLTGSAEIGFREGVQFAPTRQWFGAVPDDALARQLVDPELTLHAACLQSDEGGRFHRCVVEYRIVEIEEGREVETDGFYHWVSLAQCVDLLRYPGATTNELRSVLSMLLTWL